MAEDGAGDGGDVLPADDVGAEEGGAGFGSEDQILHGAGAGAPADEGLEPFGGVGGAGAGAADEIDGEGVEVLGDGDAADEVLEGEDAGAVEDVGEFGEAGAGGGFGDGDFFIAGGVVDADHEHEAVELGFGEGVGAFLFDGVLGGEDEEGGVEGVGAAGDGDFVLLHGFEHGGLGFGGSAVDFVGEDDVGEYGAFGEFEGAFATGEFLQDIGAGDVHGHQVGGELDAGEGEGHGLGEFADEQGFGEAGDAHEEGVTAGEEADAELLDDVILADDDPAEFGGEAGVSGAEFVDGGDVVCGEGCARGGGGCVRHEEDFLGPR